MRQSGYGKDGRYTHTHSWTHTHTHFHTHSLKPLISSSLFHHTVSARRYLQQREPEVCGSASKGRRCRRLAFHTPLTINPNTLTIIQTILFQRHVSEDPSRGFMTHNCSYLGITGATSDIQLVGLQEQQIFLRVCVLAAESDATAPPACLCCSPADRVTNPPPALKVKRCFSVAML